MVKKTYNEKLVNKGDLPKIVEVADIKAAACFGGTRMLIAPAIEYDEAMKRVPFGKLITSEILRKYLAEKHGADYTCQLTAGIFINIAAGASAERGGVQETPYWRTLKKDGELNEKYPGGVEDQMLRLESEGHEIIKRGNRYFVKDFQNKLCKL